MRINKFLAAAGLASRRKCEEYVLSGKVKVNGHVVKDLSFDVNEKKDVVECDGKKLEVASEFVYVMLHKPKGCVSTSSDEKGRKTVFDFLPEKYKKHRLFLVGRLDYDTEGLILFTNDGDLTKKLTHPSFETEKTYIANIEGEILESELACLRKGVMVDGKKTAPAKVKRLAYADKITRVEIKIKEGRNRQVRKMFEAVNKNVVFLIRKSIGGLNLGGLPRGTTRELEENEIEMLKKY